MESALLDQLPDGVVIADGEGVVVAWNETARRYLVTDPGWGIGSRLASIPLQDQEGRDWYSSVCPYDGLTSRVGIPEQSWFAADGRELLVNARLRRTGRGEPVSGVSLVLRSARGRALLDRERSDLVATVAHELRSPLTGVRGFVTTLLNRWDRLNDEQRKLMLTTVNADAERLSRLITELLDVARIDTGRLPLYPRELELIPVLQRVIDSVGQSTARTLNLEYDDDAAVVFADPDKLIQVFTNLIENAVRHGEGEVRVQVDGQDPVRVIVDDEGDGIPEAIRSRVFTKFWKHGVRGGSGLGMYIVNGLVRVHGGEVVIDDRPGGGARIVVRWPATDQRD